jgi:hypothetical protein
MKLGIKGIIIQVDQRADDDGVFEQDILFKLPDGTIIKIFDPDLLVKPEMAGKDMVISILAFLNMIQYCREGEFGIKPSGMASSALTRSNIFYGKLLAFDTKWKHISYVDVGLGIIKASEDALGKKFEIGDWLEIKANRTDLIKINNT